MALLEGSLRSEALRMDTAVTVSLPQKMEEAERPVLYLLHGLGDDHTAWVRRSNIDRYANREGIAVIMPEVQRVFIPIWFTAPPILRILRKSFPPVRVAFPGDGRSRPHLHSRAVDGRLRRPQGGAAPPGTVCGGGLLFGRRGHPCPYEGGRLPDDTGRDPGDQRRGAGAGRRYFDAYRPGGEHGAEAAGPLSHLRAVGLPLRGQPAAAPAARFSPYPVCV